MNMNHPHFDFCKNIFDDMARSYRKSTFRYKVQMAIYITSHTKYYYYSTYKVKDCLLYTKIMFVVYIFICHLSVNIGFIVNNGGA